MNDKGLSQSTSIEDMDSNNEDEVTTEEKKERHNRKDEEKLVNSKQLGIKERKSSKRRMP